MDQPISLEARRVDLRIELPFQLGRARVDPPAHEYVIGGTVTRMQPQTVKVLVALHDKIREVVTREELVDRCWDGRVVGEDVINRTISLLRRLAEKNGGFTIETVPRAGYRLLDAPVGSAPTRKWIPLAAAAALALAGVAFAWMFFGAAPVRQGVPQAPVVTVAPFTAADANDPLERQVAEAAPTSVSRMLSQSGFPIVLSSGGSSARKSDFIISGNVSRNGNLLEATVQLNGARDGAVAFSHDFESTLAQSASLPDRIGATFAADLAWTGAEMALDRRHPLDPQVVAELMTSMSTTIEQGDNLRSYQIDRRLAPMEPNSAIVQLALAVDTGRAIALIPPDQRADAVATARQAADRALRLAPEFGDAYITWCILHSPVRRPECDARLRKAMRIDPSSSFVPGALSSILYDAGLIDEAVTLARQSLANDPYKPAKMARMIRMLEASGREDEAASVFSQATRLWPDTDRMEEARLLGMIEDGNDEAIARLARENPSEMPKAAVFEKLAMAGQRRDRAEAKRTCTGAALGPLLLAQCMAVAADLGDMDLSYAIAANLFPAQTAGSPADEDRLWLDRPDSFPTEILTGPAGKAMRGDPRFIALANRTGLLSYWRSGRMPDFCTREHEPVCARIGGARG